MKTEIKINSCTKTKLLSLILISLMLFVNNAPANVMKFYEEASFFPTEKQEITLEKPSSDTLSKTLVTLAIPQDKVVTAVAPLRLNVLYIGVENPVTISVSGVGSSKIKASINNGTIKGENGEYIVQPSSPGNAIITVTVDGKTVNEAKFRVKNIPDPVAFVCKKKGGGIKKDELSAATEIEAVLVNFDFDTQFTIKTFTVSANIRGYQRDESNHSNQITDAMRDLIKSVAIGAKVIFTDIVCVGPDGVEREINGIIFKLED